ncbi:MAG: FAD-binding protein [Victivallales bacterium]|nr:FAD-binding protein [Victivallales bacterium]
MKEIAVHTLIIGSGAAGLCAALRLRAEGIDNIAILTEGLEQGTSINTGSDKQTYYKLGLYAADNDSPEALAKTFYAGGSMHGDLALVEAALSVRAFCHLANLGVPFPHDEYGQFIGYKTDHDPLRRATSCGPYTSREMCLALIREVKRLNIPLYEGRTAVKLLTLGNGQDKRVCGALALASEIEVYQAENVIFAVGGPGGLYRTSVYPAVHTGAIGLALEAGAAAQNLPESQFGLASIKFRWNVSGTYMQVLPKFISTAPDGQSDTQEFLRPFFESAGKMNSTIFLKGYQWPFDSRKVAGGSSIIDILVYIETVIKGRRVFLDFRENGADFAFEPLDAEAYEYLSRSEALFGTPLERLRHMNPGAISLYEDHGIHLVNEPLEIAVCAQHNNGGLAGNKWWESVNIKHLFPIGEVNGSHGIYRPGGSALNSGQAGAFRAAAYIAAEYREQRLTGEQFKVVAAPAVAALQKQLASPGGDWRTERGEFQSRMSEFGAHIRCRSGLDRATAAAWRQYRRLASAGAGGDSPEAAVENLRNIQLCLAHAVYLDAIREQVESGVGSRGSALTLDRMGTQCHPGLGTEWNFQPENPEYREKILETVYTGEKVEHCWRQRRPLPHCDGWFENVWSDFRNGKIFKD